MIKNTALLVKNLKFLRLQNNLSLEFMAEKLGLGDKTSYHAYEIGKANVSVSNLIILAEFFDYSLDTIIKSDLSQGLDTNEAILNDILSRLTALEKRNN